MDLFSEACAFHTPKRSPPKELQVVSATVKGLGERPVWLRLHLDDGRLIDLATCNRDVTPATGPFVAVSLM